MDDNLRVKAGAGYADLRYRFYGIGNEQNKLGVSLDRVIVTVQDHGNTSAASIPLALSVGVERGQIKPGDLLVAEAIGGGLAWGSVVLRG